MSGTLAAMKLLAPLLLFSLAVCSQEPPAPKTPPPRNLRAKGPPKEMGTQAGTLLKEPIRILLRDYLGAMLKERRILAVLAARQMERHIPARYIEEMKALAEAAVDSGAPVLSSFEREERAKDALERAEKALTSGDRDAAEAALNEAFQYDPEHPDIAALRRRL